MALAASPWRQRWLRALGAGQGHVDHHVRSNAAVSGAILEDVARPDGSGLALLREAADAMRLSARGYHRVLRVARTLADLDGAAKVGRLHLAEALSYRALADEIRRAA
jgi:magnesium chelatase family protein